MKANKTHSSLSLNFVMNIILKLSTLIFPLITFPYVSRILLAEGYGKIQTATAFVSYFTLVAQLGIPTYGIRTCSIVRDDRNKLTKTAHELLIIQTIMTAISYAVFFVCLQTIPKLREERLLYLINSAGIFLGTLGMEWLFQAVEQYTYITMRSLAFKVLSVIAMFALVHSQEDYLIYAGISVAASTGSNLLNLTQLPKYIDLRPQGDYQIKRHVKPILVFFAMVCAATVYTNLDTVMLGFMSTDADVGYYSAGVKIKNILVSVVSALGTVLLPRVSYYFEQKQMDQFWAVLKKALNFTLLAALPLTVYFIIFARNGIYFLSGESYENAVTPMVIIMPTVLLIGMTGIIGYQLLVPTGRENIVMYSTIVGALVDLVANAILIPRFQASGAAMGTLIAELAVFGMQLWILRREIVPLLKTIRFHHLAIAMIICSTASFWVCLLPISNFFILAISAVIFFGVYALYLHLIKEPFVMDLEKKVFLKFSSIRKK